MFQLYVGDTSPSIPGHFATNGVDLNLSAIEVLFSMTSRDTGALKVDAQPVTLVGGGVSGDCQYDWQVGDTDTEAVYDAWMDALVDGINVQSLDLGAVHVDVHGKTTLVQVRELVETGLSDTALQILLDDAQQTVDNLAGTVGQQVLLFDGHGLATLGLMRPAGAVVQVRERPNDQVDWIVTDPLNYLLENGGRTLRKVYATGQWWGDGWQAWNGNGIWWSRRTEVTYLPISDVAVRRRVIIDLVRLGTQYSGLSQEKIGQYMAFPLEYQMERERLLRQLTGTRSKLRFA